MTLPYESVLLRIGQAAGRLGLEAYLVGGAVRDALLRRPTTDLDVVAVGSGAGVRLAEAAAEALGALPPVVYEAFGTAAVTVPQARVAALGGDEPAPLQGPLHLEFVGARRESYRRDSRKPIVEDGTLEEDLARRDFTVNALAVRLDGEAFGAVVDPFGGLQDLNARRLKTPLDPAETFSDDPLRMLRGARFAAQLGFELDPEAVAAMTEMAGRIEIVSPERVTDELLKLVDAPQPSEGLALLGRTGLLDHVLPELAALRGVEYVGAHGHKDNFFHTLEVLDNVALAQMQPGSPIPPPGTLVPSGDPEVPEDRGRWLRWVALLHDMAKPETKRFAPGTGWTFHGHEDRGARRVPRVFKRLRLPLDGRMRYVQKLIALHHRPVALVDDEVTDSAVRRLLFEAGETIDDLMLFVRADVTSKNEKRKRRYLKAFDRVEAKMAEVEAKDRLRAFQPPIDGHEIMALLGEGEGLAVGIVKERVREAVLEGDIPNEHGPARALAEALKPDALRRARLFHAALKALQGPERRATGAVKEAVVWDDLPEGDEDALAYLRGVAQEALRGASGF